MGLLKIGGISGGSTFYFVFRASMCENLFGAQPLLSTARKLVVLLRCSEHRHDVNVP